MKLLALIPSLACVVIAGCLVLTGRDGWPWFLVAGVVLAGVASQMDEP